MAESAVSIVVEILGNLLTDKIMFLKGVNENVRTLRDELVRMKCFLKDADQKQDEDERIRNWVSEIRDVSYDAEDLIEVFVRKMESLKRKSTIIKLAYFPAKIYNIDKVGREIQSVRSRITDIRASRETYGIKNLGEGENDRANQELHHLRRTSAHTEDKNLVGIEEKTAFMVSQLLRDDSSRCVFLITGMGGVGKTTLARRIYNHADVQEEFPYRAWVCVSEKYNFREIMKSIIKQLVASASNESLAKMDDADLEEKLHRCLKSKHYMVVLDDIWQETGWDILSRLFPDEGRGNRVLLTSRNKNVANHADPLHSLYELETLGEEESWRLFSKSAFTDGRCPSSLENLGRKIVNACGGLPLAITTIGSLLLQKRGLRREWESVYEDIRSHFGKGLTGVSTILELSYRDLSPDLKFCFKYLGLFPEDLEIYAQKLTLMWIAEGIVAESHGGRSLEDIAADYLEQLISRNMVQAGKVSVEDKVKSCRLHDLFRDLAIKKGKDENLFTTFISGRNDDQPQVKFRYIAVQDDSPFSDYLTSRLRTIIAFGKVTLNFRGKKLLRVLDLYGSKIHELPKEIGEMRLLRYLGLRGTAVFELPSFLARLQRLQTLDVFNDFAFIKIPNVIWKLESLRHLIVWHLSSDEPLKIEGLKSLRTLVSIHYDMLIGSSLITLTNLQKLAIRVGPNSQMVNFFAPLSQLRNFRVLYVISESLGSEDSEELPPLDGICNISHLSELKLFGTMGALPHLPRNLTRLVLFGTELEEDPMPMLAKLEHLSSLKLEKSAYPRKEVRIPRNGFCRLNFLQFKRMIDLRSLAMEKGALPELRSLRIRSCRYFRRLPEELKSVGSLQTIELVNMPEELVSRVLDLYKDRQVPSVRIFKQDPWKDEFW